MTLHPLQPQTWHALLLRGESGAYDRVLIAPAKDAAAAWCTLRLGEWSDKLSAEFTTEAGVRTGVFKFKLLELDGAGREIKLFLSPLCAVEGFHHPPEIAAELAHLVPEMPLPSFGWDELNLDWIDDETMLEILRESHHWLGHTAAALLGNHEWNLFAMHLHCPDWAYHAIGSRLDPLTEPDPQVRDRWARLERAFHRAWDEMLGMVLAQADEQTLIAVVSDHGAQTTTHHLPLGKILADAGYLVNKQDEQGQPVVDWTRTRAVPQRSCYIYLNVKGRDPHGIVEPGEEYEKLREEIIALLLNYTDPETGLKPFTFVWRQEDARVIGLYGACIGDLVFANTGQFAGQHGNVLPTTQTGIGSIEGLLILNGPGIKRGSELERTAWLTDLVPTLCHLTEWPLPAQTEGAILYQALQDPDAKSTELARLRKNYERLKRVEDADVALTHRYNM
jgi:predicted AlkP superfamily phosphohydrolase/phosphomutase